MSTETAGEMTKSRGTNGDVAVLHATIGRRLKASIVDSLVLMSLIIIIPLAAHALAGESITGLWLLMYAPVLILEPLLVSFWGQTIGQYLFGIKVVSERTSFRCPLARSFLRFYTKALLGLWSMIYMVFSTKHKAVHDYVAGTTVILSPKRMAQDPSFAVKGEIEQSEDTKFVYPSNLRRFAFFIIWYFSVFFGMHFVFFIILSVLIGDRADRLMGVAREIQQLFWAAVLFVVASLAAKGHLPGAKRKAKFSEGRTTEQDQEHS